MYTIPELQTVVVDMFRHRTCMMLAEINAALRVTRYWLSTARAMRSLSSQHRAEHISCDVKGGGVSRCRPARELLLHSGVDVDPATGPLFSRPMVPPDPDDGEHQADDDDKQQQLPYGGPLQSPARGPRHHRLATPHRMEDDTTPVERRLLRNY